jgi:transcriptional regulator with XRE-family HTH domain
MITNAQIRAARALIGWKQTDLAGAAGISEMSVKNIERGNTDPRVSTLEAIRVALESAGVAFQADGETTTGGPGVRLPKQSSEAPHRPQPDSEAGIIDSSDM